VSMVPSETLDMLDACLRHARDSRVRFGGCVVVVVGDFFQLAPILTSAAIARAGGREWAFQALAWPHFKPVQLVQVVRQQGDQRFANVLNRMRVGECTPADARWLNRHHTPSGHGVSAPLALFPSNAKCTRRNDSMRLALPGPDILVTPDLFCVQLLRARPWTVARTGPAELPSTSTVRYHARGIDPITLRIGCRVRATRNVYTGFYPYRELQIANGQRGTVLSTNLDDDEPTVTVRWDAIGTLEAIELPVSRVTWSRRQSFRAYNINSKGNPVFALSRQFPLAVAYALTVHSAQGMSVDNELDVDHRVMTKNNGAWVYAVGGAYVALSRATRMQLINMMQFFDVKHVAVSAAVRAYYMEAFGALAYEEE